MTTKLNLNKMYLLAIIGIFLLPFAGFSMKETEKTITKEATVSPTSQIRFENKLGPVKVETWDHNRVKLVTRVIIDGKEEDIVKVIDHISDINFSPSSGDITVNTQFYKQYSETFPGEIRIMLNNGDIIKGITKLKVSYTLTLPRTNPLALINKYHDLSLPDLEGDLTLTLYESDVTAGEVMGKAFIRMKYSTGTFGSLQETSLNLYESKARISSLKGLSLTSKYSELALQEAGEMILDCYEDKITVSSHGNVKMKAKYTEFTLADFNVGTFDLYECKLEAGKTGELSGKAKYSIITLKSITTVSFQEAYEVKFSSTHVGSLEATSKYSIFTIQSLDGSVSFPSSYEDKLVIDKMESQFSGISVNSKYTDLDITFESGSIFQIDADLKYTDLDFPETSFREIRYHKDGSDFSYQGITKGAGQATAPIVKLIMYEGNVKLK
ncbi:MAG: hypothetical protein JXA23_07535 [Bacteroidales bacterium]|nr:hypothetical protein [Bacteroidales bacterium]